MTEREKLIEKLMTPEALSDKANMALYFWLGEKMAARSAAAKAKGK